MVSLKALGVRLRKAPPQRLYPLDEALKLAGVTAPTFYRWIRAGRIDDCRIHGSGRTHLSATAVLELRELATRVEVLA